MVTTSAPTSSPSLSAAWFGGAFFTILVPIFIMTIGRLTNSANNNQDDDGNNNNNNNNEEENGGTPWWYFSGGNERERDEEKAPPVLIATYLWSLLIFLTIVFYGHHVMRTGADLHGVVVALCLFASFSIISMFLYGGVEGAVETDGRAIEEHGFVGQFGVMMYLTSMLWFVFSVSFACVLHRKSKSQFVETIEVGSADYQIHDSPSKEAV